MVKAPGGGLDALHAAPMRLAFLHAHLGDRSIRLHDLDNAEILAMGWIAELARFSELSSAFGERAMILDFEQVLADTAIHLSAVRAHLNLPSSDEAGSTLRQTGIMQAYAKQPTHRYTPADRAHDLDLSRRTFAAEIERAMRWADRTLTRFPQLETLAPWLR
jgi:hypothetical protein